MECGKDGFCDSETGDERVAEVPPGVAKGLPRKHSCPDCHFCQICSDSRCASCRRERESEGCSKKMSISEQILLYDEINSKDPWFKKFRKKCG
ncbi:MAG: hypothetical protein WAW37_10555 [Syntrophobacteraceae bacterium]